MQRTLVRGRPVVAMGELGVIDDGAAIVEGSKIVAVGASSELEDMGEFDLVVGGPDHVVLPGFVNAHYHSECWTAPGLIDIIFELGNLYMGSGLIDATEEVIELLATLGLIHAAKGGQTTLLDVFYGRPWLPRHGADAVLRAYRQVGLRVGLAVTMRDRNRYAHEDDERFLSRFPDQLAEEIRSTPLGYAWPIEGQFELFHDLRDAWDDAERGVRVVLAPDWAPVCSDELYRRCVAASSELGVPLTTHVLETRAEFAWSAESGGGSAVQRLGSLGVMGGESSFSHFVWASDDDIARCAELGVTVVHCPGSNLRSAAGLCRLKDLQDAGCRVAFGTDGVSVGDTEDFFEELRLASYLQRQPGTFADHRLDSLEVLRGATEIGATAAGFGGIVGRIEVGMEADLLAVSKERIFFPEARYRDAKPLDVLLDRARASDIDVVMVGGRVVVEDGKTLLVDEDSIRARINELNEELYRPTPEASRRRELAQIMTPEIESLCERWYSQSVGIPASILNTRYGVSGGTDDSAS